MSLFHTSIQKYAELSGLKINIDNTKVVWIGNNIYSSDTMCVKWGLEWGSTTFTLLGLHFSVNIDEIEKLNYTPKLIIFSFGLGIVRNKGFLRLSGI
jgi:hypothetical protein